jgi:acyl-CoA reductase-like NAD-dependent aldehyde dehydrogenase
VTGELERARLIRGVAEAARSAARRVARSTAAQRGEALTAIAAAIDRHRPAASLRRCSIA